MGSSEPSARRASGSRDLTAVLFLLPAFVLYGLFVLLPMAGVLWIALHRWNGYGPMTFAGLANFHDLLADPVFRTSLTHSLLWMAAGAILPPLLGLGIAAVVRRSRGRTALLAALLLPALLPATAVAAIWTLMYSPASGAIDGLLHAAGLGRLAPAWLGDPHLALGALIAAWLWTVLGIATGILLAGFTAIGREYIEIALVEGAGTFSRLRHVMLHGLRGHLVLAAIVGAALAAQVFDLVFVTTGGGPGYATMILPVDMYGRAFGGQTGQGAAAAAVQLLLGVLLALALLLSRRAMTSLATEEGQRPAPASPAFTLAASLIALLVLVPLLSLPILAAGQGTVSSHAVRGAWSAGMGGGLLWSLALALFTLAAVLLVSVPAAFALARLVRGPVRTALIAILVVGLFEPTPVLTIPLFYLLKSLGLLDSFWGIALPEAGRAVPLAVLVLWLAFDGAPHSLFDAARVDGASPSRQLWSVGLPLVTPALGLAGGWAFLSSWNEYLLPTIVSQDGTIETAPQVLGSFIGRYNTQFDLLAAGALLVILPWLLLWLLAGRYAGRALWGEHHR